MKKTQTLEKLLNGSYIDPQNGKPVSLPIDKVIIESAASLDAKDIISSLNIGNKFCVVSDVSTHAVLGEAIEKTCEKPIGVILPSHVKPDMISVQKIMQEASNADAIIAVGSGTINDICKYASYKLNKPYVVFGTAPSMNGYTSANASIIENGYKKTFAAHMPKAVILDLDVLSLAPKRLIRSGLGDSLCRSTAQVDWLLSHFILNTYYNEMPFSLLKEYESDLFDNSKQLMQGDKEIMNLLTSTLIVSGFGMYICGGSYPASQGEHLIAHTMEMKYGSELPQTYHGEEIGITTLTMARLQERIINETPEVKISDNYENEIIRFFGKNTSKQCLEEYKAKVSAIQLAGDKINWHDFKERIEKISVSSLDLQVVLQNAGAPTNAKEIGWDIENYNQAIKYSKYMRNRFTFLDLV